MCSWFNKIFNLFSGKDKSPSNIKPDLPNATPLSKEDNKTHTDVDTNKRDVEPQVSTEVKPASVSFSINLGSSDDDSEINTNSARFVPNRNFSLRDYYCYTDKTNSFTVIDFETANQYPDSICQIGLVVVKKGLIADVKEFLVKPPYDDFRNSKIHGITAEDVKDSPTFKELWPTILPYIEDKVLAAYNLSFDIGCLEAVLDRYEIPSPDYMAFDILQSARQIDTPMKNHKLVTVAKVLNISHKKVHNAADDARAAAEVQTYAFGTQKYLYNNIYFKMTDRAKIKKLQKEIMSGDALWHEVSKDYLKYKEQPFEECSHIFNTCKEAVERGCKDAHLFRAYGELLEKSGDANTALQMYQQALSLNPKIGLKKKVDKILKEMDPK